MENKFFVLLFCILLLLGCSHYNKNKKLSYPYKVIKIIKSEDNQKSVIIIKTGINGGATVGFNYQFFIAKTSKKLSTNNRFLWLKELKEYNIKWTSINTININVKAKSIIEFKGEIYSSKQSYFITKFTFESE